MSNHVEPQNDLPPAITDNLNPRLPLRHYQIAALGRLRTALEAPATPTGTSRHYLFHMATGSGKTLVMAAALLELYSRGYRDVVFFVNSTAIIDKTRENFLNAASPKYLFNDCLQIVGRRLSIRATDNFATSHPDAINIVFTTIQGLHAQLNAPREGGLGIDDFAERPVVLLSDEAHHLNADTKRGSKPPRKGQQQAALSWENSVQRLLHRHNHHILLEFTATADFNHAAIAAKYRDKCLFNYSLKQFCQDGYSKNVRVLQSTLAPLQRALQAVILSHYRQSCFADHGIAAKPVVLFKSKTIKESRAFHETFYAAMAALTPQTLDDLSSEAAPVVRQAFAAMASRGITSVQLLTALQKAFSPAVGLLVNSRDDCEAKQLLLNRLESPDNPYRLIFAVDKLNEGWDVLNLFDIVRLYDSGGGRSGQGGNGRTARKTVRKTASNASVLSTFQQTTVAEAQLIGRGARYYPFVLREVATPRYRRKFDIDSSTNAINATNATSGANNLENRVLLETLYYHAAHNPAYIAELNRYLVTIGLSEVEKNEVGKSKSKQQLLQPLPSALSRQSGKSGKTSPKAKLASVRRQTFRQSLFAHHESPALWAPNRDAASTRSETATVTHSYQLNDFPPAILRHAANRVAFYRFDRLQALFADLPSRRAFLSEAAWLGTVTVVLTMPSDEPLSFHRPEHRQALAVALQQVLSAIASYF